MTFYQQISPLGVAHSLGVDDTKRAVFAVNFIARKVDSDTTPEELYGLLVSGGVFASGRVFVEPSATLPPEMSVEAPSTYISMIIGEGPGPEYVHNSIGPKYTRPAIMVLARSRRAVDARAAAQTAYNILKAVRNRDVAPVTIT